MEDCEHRQLIKEVCEASGDTITEPDICMICAVQQLEKDQAKADFGAGFSFIRYRYDQHKRALETLLVDSSIEQIPPKYIHFMAQLVNRKPDESTLLTKPTGIAGRRSWLMQVVPGIYTRGYVEPDVPLEDPDDVPPASGWTHFPVPQDPKLTEDEPPEPKKIRLTTDQYKTDNQ